MSVMSCHLQKSSCVLLYIMLWYGMVLYMKYIYITYGQLVIEKFKIFLTEKKDS